MQENSTNSPSQPLISIGIPSYNNEDSIRPAIESVLSQNYQNLEIIICDDASTDRTAEICEKYAELDDRIQFYRNEKNLGMYANWQKLLSMATGKYFMWAAGDDVHTPDFVSSLVSELEMHSDAGIAMTATDLVLENGEHFSTVRFRGIANPNNMSHFRLMLRSAGIGRGRKKYSVYIYGLYRTDLIKSTIRFFVDTLLSDRLFVTMMALVTKFRYVDEVYYIKTRHPKYVLRYPHEKFEKLAGTYLKRYILIYQLSKMILDCDMIPWYRKIYMPFAAIGISAFISRGIMAQIRTQKSSSSNP